ncbi:putative peptide chain release factor 1 [Paramyrothecium foliicola]|nr:putative peptide chain release factor 1 [Paramyrothecium foliicola]
MRWLFPVALAIGHIFCCRVQAAEFSLPLVLEVDLIFPRANATYAVSTPFPVLFSIQNAAAAYEFGLYIRYSIYETAQRERVSVGSGSLEWISPGFSYNTHPDPATSEPFIYASNDTETLPPGTYSLSWSVSRGDACSGLGFIQWDWDVKVANGTFTFDVAYGAEEPGFQIPPVGDSAPNATNTCAEGLAGVSYSRYKSFVAYTDLQSQTTTCPVTDCCTSAPLTPCAVTVNAAQASSLTSALNMTVIPSEPVTTSFSSSSTTSTTSTVSSTTIPAPTEDSANSSATPPMVLPSHPRPFGLDNLDTNKADSNADASSFSVAPSLLQRAQNLTAEHDDLQKTLSSSFDSAKAKRVGELSRVAAALEAWNKAQASVAELRAMIDDPEQDPDLAAIARDELDTERARLEPLGRDLSASLTPRHPYADFPCLIEFRPGPGGTEGRYFTDSVFKMYKNLCVRRGYRASVLKYDMADSAGDQSSAAGEMPVQEAVLEVQDPGAFDIFRSEAGMHRVQRIPSTESKGRVHTSAVAVWVLPSFPESGSPASDIDVDDPESDFYVNPQDVKVETMRARGAGGQHVNKTESAIRLTHHPTGTTVSMQDHRSQARNREDAWRVMRVRIADQRRQQREEEAARLRSSVLAQNQITRGDKIRTYNYNQDRCTDHRAGLDVHNLPDVLEGGETLDRVMDAAREWLVAQDVALVIAEEEAKAKTG